MKFCDYGCGQEAKHQFKNGKWCCGKNVSQCPVNRKKAKERGKTLIGEKNPFYNKKHTYESKQNISKNRKGKLSGEDHPLYGTHRSESTKLKISNGNKGKCKRNPPWNKGKSYEELYGKEKAEKLKKAQSERVKNSIPWNEFTLEYIKMYHPFFSKIEEMRYNPDKPGEKEIQVHCKNHKCKNSKEKGGWFTPTKSQMTERIRQIEKEYGNGGSYLYCSQECKDSCMLYNLRADPFQETELPYTQEEIQLWRETILKQDNYECQKCSSKKDLHCHHIVPIKENEMLALDPDNGIVLCQDCHYEIGHKTSTECSTGNLASKSCKK